MSIRNCFAAHAMLHCEDGSVERALPVGQGHEPGQALKNEGLSDMSFDAMLKPTS